MFKWIKSLFEKKPSAAEIKAASERRMYAQAAWAQKNKQQRQKS
jgi:hypothetical protein